MRGKDHLRFSGLFSQFTGLIKEWASSQLTRIIGFRHSRHSTSVFASLQFYHLPFIICHHINSLEQKPTIYSFHSKFSTQKIFVKITIFTILHSSNGAPRFWHLRPQTVIFIKSRTFLRKFCLSKCFSIESIKKPQLYENKGRGRRLQFTVVETIVRSCNSNRNPLFRHESMHVFTDRFSNNTKFDPAAPADLSIRPFLGPDRAIYYLKLSLPMIPDSGRTR